MPTEEIIEGRFVDGKGQIAQKLDACLLTEGEMKAGPQGWKEYEDPFPLWRQIEEEVHS